MVNEDSLFKVPLSQMTGLPQEGLEIKAPMGESQCKLHFLGVLHYLLIRSFWIKILMYKKNL